MASILSISKIAMPFVTAPMTALGMAPYGSQIGKP